MNDILDTGHPTTSHLGTDYLSATELHAALTVRDLSDPAQGPHAMQLVLSAVAAALTSRWGIPSRLHRLPAAVPVADNYDRLGFGADAITRDRRYSRYLGPTVMLRSHTSAAIPDLLDRLASGEGADTLHVLPGLVYRRDAIDRTHTATPHQLDLWRLREASGPTARLDRTHLDSADLDSAHLDTADLEEMIATVVESVLPGAVWRAVPSPHPYTEGGRQVDVRVEGEWLELAECGLVAPDLLARCGLDPERWSGLALGMGLDRALMLRKGIPDIRVLRSADPRIAAQLLDLEPWRPVSSMPPVRRDISIVVAEDADEETLGDRARAAMGAAADDLEEVAVIALTPHDALLEAAQRRLGSRPGQANALVRLVLRPLDRTLTDVEANVIRDRVYLALHEGPHLELIAAPSDEATTP